MDQRPDRTAAAVLLFCMLAPVTVAEDPTADEHPSAAELVLAARANEKWVQDVKGLRLRLESPDPDDKTKTATIDVAFDDRRFYYSNRSLWRYEIRIWNGKEARFRDQYFENDQLHYAIDDEPGELLHDYPFLYLAWLRAEPPSLWWRDPNKVAAAQLSSPDKFEFAGEQNFRDVACYVVRHKSPGYVLTWYIGKRDRLLRSIQTSFRTGKEWLNWTTDYREIKPGCWIPFEQGFSSSELDPDGERVVTHERTWRVAEVTINPQLDDSLFELPFEEGVSTTDFRYGPPIYYKYVPNLPDDERERLLEKAREAEANRKREREKMETLRGQPAAPFPPGRWINSAPLEMSKLIGKPVLLEFWSIHCGPCRTDFDKLNKAHANSKRTGVVVIGVHDPATTDEFSKIEAFVKEHKLNYPIFVEDLPKDRAFHPKFGRGTLNQHYQVRGIPHSIVIDPEGKVASNGLWAPNSISHAEFLAAGEKTTDDETAESPK